MRVTLFPLTLFCLSASLVTLLQQPPNDHPTTQPTQITTERRQWKRFGAAARETADDSVTVRHVEEIPFDRIRPAKATAQEKKFTDMQVRFCE